MSSQQRPIWPKMRSQTFEMPCYHPQRGYRSRVLNPSGKRSIVFNPRDGFVDMPVDFPCGQCIGCRLEKSRQWAMRCVHEAQLHDENCFITLTFDDAHLDPAGSLRKADFQKFMKRLRKHYEKKVRYFHCGEYGDRTYRPHHHAILFGLDFADKELYKQSGDNYLYTSPQLQKLWPFGFSTIGEMSWETAAYTARYCMKKVTGERGKEYYGERTPPYNSMSRRPGIASNWFKRYSADVYPSDALVVRGKITCKPPAYYDRELEKLDPNLLKRMKANRLKQAGKHREDQTPERLRVREELTEMKVNKLERLI